MKQLLDGTHSDHGVIWHRLLKKQTTERHRRNIKAVNSEKYCVSL